MHNNNNNNDNSNDNNINMNSNNNASSGRRNGLSTGAIMNGVSSMSTNRTVAGGTTIGTILSNTNANSSTSKNNKNDKTKFYPKLIASQIVALQCFHYFILSVFFQINNVLYGTSITIDRIFTDQYVRIWNWNGWPDTCAILLSSAVGAVLLVVIVEKSKKCLDFAVTLFFVHVVFCTIYQGVPKAMEWWVVHIAGTILMVLLGEYLCSRREMEDIPLLHL